MALTPSSTPGLTPSRTPSDTPTPSTTLPTTPANPAEDICTRDHALYAFDCLCASLAGREHVKAPFSNAKDKFALFVTWNTVRGSKKPALRGCIGNFSPMRLDTGIAEYALVAALEDHRFSPIKAAELPLLSVSVSLLTPFTPVATPLSWTPGVHGIHITFPHPTTGRTLSATYLPDVTPEQGWTREEAVISLIHKAGYRGKVAVGDALWNSIAMKVYGSVKAKVSFEEYTVWAKDHDVAVATKSAAAGPADSTWS